MDENLENELKKIMNDANDGVNQDLAGSMSSMAEAIASFYKSLLDNGVPRLVALPLTAELVRAILAR